MASYCELLRNARESMGITQTELAERLGVVQRTISSWEIGSRAPTFVQMVAAADAIGIPLCKLAGDTYQCGFGNRDQAKRVKQ